MFGPGGHEFARAVVAMAQAGQGDRDRKRRVASFLPSAGRAGLGQGGEHPGKHAKQAGGVIQRGEAEIAGDDMAKTVQLGLEYAPAPPFDSGHPSTASADTRARFDAVRARMMEERTEEARKAAAMMLG